MRFIFAIFLVLFLLFHPAAIAPAQAQLNITEAESNQLDELVKKAFDATDAGEFTKAEVYWTELIKIYPDNAAGWSNRGNSKMSQNLTQEALSDYNKSVELAPNYPDPYLNRGAALESLGKWQEAIADYQTAMQVNSRFSTAFGNNAIAPTINNATPKG